MNLIGIGCRGLIQNCVGSLLSFIFHGRVLTFHILIIAAALKLIELKKRQMKSNDDHLFVGPPSKEVDDAWIRLIYGMVLFVSWHTMPTRHDMCNVPQLMKIHRVEIQSRYQ